MIAPFPLIESIRRDTKMPTGLACVMLHFLVIVKLLKLFVYLMRDICYCLSGFMATGANALIIFITAIVGYDMLLKQFNLLSFLKGAV